MEIETERLLLPFTHGVNVAAIDYAVWLAKESHACIVAVALVLTRKANKGARLEHIQQSKDFLEVVKRRAMRYKVPFERYEVFTADVINSTCSVSQELNCESVLLFTDGCALLTAQEVAGVMQNSECSLYMIRLPARRREGMFPLFKRVFVAPPIFGNKQAPALKEVVRVVKV